MVYALNGSDIRADGHLLLLLLLLFCVAIREEKVKKGMTDRLSIGRKQGKKESTGEDERENKDVLNLGWHLVRDLIKY